jgi:tetratricopeptide (TPR) repeat protein
MNANVKGVSLLREAATLYLAPAVDQPLDGARVLEAMANAMANGQFPAREAESAAGESLALAERLTEPGSQSIANAWMVLSLALNRAGNLAAAEHAARTTYAMNDARPKDGDNRLDAAVGNLCIILSNRGKLAEATPHCERAYATRLAGGPQIVLAMAQSRLALLRAAQGEFAAALDLSAAGLALTRELKGDVSPFGTIFTMRRAILLDDAGRHGEALPLFDKALADSAALDGPDSGEHLEARLQRARHEARVGHHRVAIDALREIVPAVAARFGADDPRALVAKTVLAKALLDSGVADAAVRELLDAAMAAWSGKDDPDAVQPGQTRLALAQWYAMNGDAVPAGCLLDALVAADSRADRIVKTDAAALRSRMPVAVAEAAGACTAQCGVACSSR